ncbi:MAG: hypothetical protein M3Y24_00810 [Acidobacteriota bacterium]|nr:hypothetical protein [Acidobacteriota bacterium]
MLIRPTLWLKIVLLAMLNAVLLVFVFLIFARLQFRFNLNSALLASARVRIVSVSSLLALQLPDTKPESWNKLLTEYSSKYPARFYLFDHTGRELAGLPVVLRPVRRAMNWAPDCCLAIRQRGVGMGQYPSRP